MKDTLAKAEGCGLAAPQVGVSKRVVIVDGRDMADVYPYLEGFVRVLVNPVIVSESEKKAEYQEGCLSIPGIYCDVVRPESMTVEYYDENLRTSRKRPRLSTSSPAVWYSMKCPISTETSSWTMCRR